MKLPMGNFLGSIFFSISMVPLVGPGGLGILSQVTILRIGSPLELDPMFEFETSNTLSSEIISCNLISLLSGLVIFKVGDSGGVSVMPG
jgi:hypothetical protein